MLCLDNLTCSRDSKILFKELSLSLFMNSILFIRAVNGSGKTSLLRMIAGLLDVLQGKILWNDVLIATNKDQFQKDILYISHKNPFSDSLTVLDNLTFWAKLNNSEEMILSVIYYFGLEEVLNKKFFTLSAGWKRRISMGAVMASRAKLLLLDEPFVNLDEDTINLCKNMLISRAESGAIILIADNQNTIIKGSSDLYLKDFFAK